MSKLGLPFDNWRDRVINVCFDCGRQYGPQTMEECIAITYHYGRCDVCLNENVGVTDPRDFGRLEKLTYREWIYRRKSATLKQKITTVGKLATVGVGGKI